MLETVGFWQRWQGFEKLSAAQVQQLVEDVSQTYFQRKFRHEAYFNARLKTTGGRYHLTTHVIDLNPQVLAFHGMAEFVGVIKHELCHYHLHLAGKGYKHRDADFKQLLKSVGGSRFVKALPAQNAPSYHQYQCKKCGLIYQRKRRMDLKKYVCGKCHGPLATK